MKFNGLKELEKAIADIQRDFPKETGKFMTRQALKVEREAKKGTGVVTGTLRASWGHVKGSDKFERIVYSKTDYASHYEFGHRLKNRKTGKWVTNSEGDVKVVEGKYPLKKALDAVNEQFESELKALVKKVMK